MSTHKGHAKKPSGKVAKALSKVMDDHRAGRLDAAERGYLKILKVVPNQSDAFGGLSVLYLQAQRNGEAIQLLTRWLSVTPNLATPHNRLGMALKRENRFDEALGHYQQAAALDPSVAGTFSDIGICLEQKNRLEEAVDAYQQALNIDPNLLNGHSNLGALQKRLKRYPDALISFRHAARLDPGNGIWPYQIATCHVALDQASKAEAAARESIRLEPNRTDAHLLLGRLLMDMRRPEDAAESFARSVSLTPQLLDARALMVDMWRKVARWPQLAEHMKYLEDDLERRPGIAIHPQLMLGGDFSAERQGKNNRWFVKNTLDPDPAPSLSFPRTPHRPLVIGYLSGDFRDHVVASLVARLFELHDRERFKIYGYSTGKTDDSPLGKRVCGGVDRFVDIRDDSVDAAAQKINDDGVDILVDLSGHTAGGRVELMARRVAPIQVSYLGFSATTGIDAMDYYIADPFVAPMAQQPHFTERLVHLPDCYMITDDRREVFSGPIKRADYDLPDDAVVFACFNDMYKITPIIYDVWMRILAATPESVLWLRHINQTTRDNLCRETAKRGIDPSRLRFFSRVNSHAEHMARQTLADLFLDTLPYNAHASTADALSVGVPMVTCPGDTFASRVAGSLLHAIGMPELVTDSLEAYEALAIELAHDPARLAALRQRLIANRNTHPLFDSEGLTRHLESAFEIMWQRYLDGEDPAPFAVPRSCKMPPAGGEAPAGLAAPAG